MRIDCPACAAAYNVPDALLVPGRAVRCLRCGAEWQALAAHPAEQAYTGGLSLIENQHVQFPPPAHDVPALNPPVAVPPQHPIAATRPMADATPSRPSAASVAFPRLRRLPVRPSVAPPEPAPEPLPLAILLPNPHRGPAVTQDGGKVAPLLAWLISLAVLAGAIALLVHYRAAVMAAWPPTGHIFTAFGLE